MFNIFDDDSILINCRYAQYQKWVKDIEEHETGYEKFTRGFENFGLNVQQNGNIVYREWAPNVKDASLIGVFSTFGRIVFDWR